MKFHLLDTARDPVTDTFHNAVSEGGVVEVGVYRVLYGYRVQAWYVAERGHCIAVNWCAGAEWHHVEHLYSLMLHCLSGIDEHQPRCLRVLPPCSRVKPYFKCADFLFELSPAIALAPGEIEPIALPPPPPLDPFIQAYFDRFK
jgi:hypothetical protein